LGIRVVEVLLDVVGAVVLVVDVVVVVVAGVPNGAPALTDCV
jgi:hypothetical protein